MKKLISLTKNELTKQLKIKWFSFLLLGLFLLSFVLPFILKNTSQHDFRREAQFQVEALEGLLHEGDSPDETVAALKKESLTRQLDMYQHVTNASKADSYWKYKLGNALEQLIWKDTLIKAHDRGISLTFDGEKNSSELVEGHLEQESLSDYMQYINADKKTKTALKETYEAKLQRLMDILYFGDHQKYTEYRLEEERKELEGLTLTKESLEESIKNNTSTPNTKADLMLTENNIGFLKNQINIMEYRLQHGINYDENNWKHHALEQKTQAFHTLSYSETYSDSQENPYTNLNNSQEEMQSAVDIIAKADMSLQTENPDKDFTPSSSPRNMLTVALQMAFVITFVIIMVGGASISSEASQGTIRLLLARPASRTKIWLSKFCSTAIIGFVSYLICLFLIFLGLGIANGFGDYLNPIYEITALSKVDLQQIASQLQGGQILSFTLSELTKTQNFFVFFLPKILVSFTSILFFVAASMFMSTLTKSTALSVAFCSLGKLGSYLVFALAASLNLKFVQYTFLPYVEMSFFTTGKNGNFLFFPEPTLYSSVNQQNGVILILLYTLLAMFISIYIFNKRDITD